MKKTLIKRFLDGVLAFSLVFSSLLVVFEYLSHNNFVRNTFALEYADFFALSILLIIFRVGLNAQPILKKNWQKIVFLFPIVLIIGSLVLFMKKHHLFLIFEQEDGLIETLQVVLLFLSTFLSAILSKLFFKKNNVLSLLFGILAMGFFFVASEEISWGQRIFDIETPKEYAELNTQGEITLHNYGPVFSYVYKAYTAIGFVGAFLWIVKKYLAKHLPTVFKETILVLVPGWQYLLYFLTAFLYNLEVHILHPRSGRNTGNALWEEPMELLLFLGVSIFLLELFVRARKTYVKK